METQSQNSDNSVTQPIIDNTNSQVQQPQIKYAGFWIRWGASFIDGIVLIIPGFIIGIIGALSGASENILGIVSQIFGVLISWTYYIFMTYNYQATLGKKVVGIKVYSETLEKPTLGKIILRETVGKIVSYFTLLIGFIMVGFTEKKQGLHDKIADTVVIYNDPTKKTPVWVIIVASFLPAIAIIGIFSAVILTSLASARAKVQEEKVKETLTSIVQESVSYSNTNSSYAGFQSKAEVISCSDNPLINISSDGKQVAIFMKSCLDKTKYLCVDSTKKTAGDVTSTDENYAKSGATSCDPFAVTGE